jgi:hypothetical protein
MTPVSVVAMGATLAISLGVVVACAPVRLRMPALSKTIASVRIAVSS